MDNTKIRKGRPKTSPVWGPSDVDLVKAFHENPSYSAMLRSLGLRPAGGNSQTLTKRLKALGVNTEKVREGRVRNSGMSNRLPNEKLFCENSTAVRHCVKKRLLSEGLLPYECADCGLKGDWNGKKLVLVLDHINGIFNDNRLDNLRFLCPNCNSQTTTFAGRNNKKPPTLSLPKVYTCPSCGGVKKARVSALCRACRYPSRI